MAQIYKTIILGAGASGLMLASMLDSKGDVLLVEGNPKAGAKLSVSGGGRCNLTNRYISAEHYLGDEQFIDAVLKKFDQNKTLKWFEGRGLLLSEEKNHQFFASSSQKVLNIFLDETRSIERRFGCKILAADHDGEVFVVQTDCGGFLGRNLVIATGGLSFPKLGATDIGLQIAQSFGHDIAKPAPALVGFTLQKEQFFFKKLSGISTHVVINIDGRSIQGNLLFAHKGISGPAVLDASLYWQKGQIEIDFLPGFDWNVLVNSKKQVSTLLPLPKRLSRALIEELGLHDKAGIKLGSNEIDKLKTLSSYRMSPAGTFGYSKAEVTKGGVKLSEIGPYSMESKLSKGLYIIGEALDATGRLGGYNLQWAFSSAAVCASALNSEKFQ